MQKLYTAALILFVLITLQTKAFSATLDCKFKDLNIRGVKSIQLKNESLVINKNIEIPLQKSSVKCSHFGRQTRFDGDALGYQIILKSCTTIAKLEGYLIDSLNKVAADILCQSVQ
jgi:hypothetical protein